MYLCLHPELVLGVWIGRRETPGTDLFHCVYHVYVYSTSHCYLCLQSAPMK